MSIETLLARLPGVRSRGPARWVAQCPAHKDRTPSLSITALPDGRILLHDFGGCDVQEVLEAVGLELAELFPARLGHHLEPVPLAGTHSHAAADALRDLAHEALIVAIAAEDLARGEVLTPEDHARLLESVVMFREAARVV